MPEPDGHDIWTPIHRSRFRSSWGALPALTVLSALPGWGRTTWLVQCRRHLETAGVATLWVDRHIDLLAALAAPPGHPDVVLVDDVLFGFDDGAWDDLASSLRRHPERRFLVSSVDLPPRLLGEGLDTSVLDERDLRFDASELEELGPQIVARAHVDHSVPEAILRGAPALLRRYALRSRRRAREGLWAPPHLEPAGQVLDGVLGPNAPSQVRQTAFARLLEHAGGFRRFTPDALSGWDGPDIPALVQRLAALPLCAPDINDEAGADDLMWTRGAWAWFERSEVRADRRDRLRLSEARLAATGHVTSRLIYLLAVDDLGGAEQLVGRELRGFLLLIDSPTADALLARSDDELEPYPSLALLAAELRSRAHGQNLRSVRAAREAVRVLRTPPGESARAQLTLVALTAFAAVASGDRALAHRQLVHVVEGLGRAPLSTRRRCATSTTRARSPVTCTWCSGRHCRSTVTTWLCSSSDSCLSLLGRVIPPSSLTRSRCVPRRISRGIARSTLRAGHQLTSTAARRPRCCCSRRVAMPRRMPESVR